MDAITDVLFLSTPPACVTCGARVSGTKMLRYLFDTYTVHALPEETLTKLGIVRTCCRRTYMTVPISEQAIEAFDALPPDETTYKALSSSVFERPAPSSTSDSRRVSGRGRKAGAAPSATQQYPYNVYATPKANTSELFKAFRVYGPEDLESVREYTQERDRREPVSVMWKDFRNPTPAQLQSAQDEMIETMRKSRR